MKEYDNRGNLVYYKNSNMEMWWEYDINDNDIYCKRSDGHKYWCDYDKNNNKIHYNDSYGYEIWWEYDKDNNRIHYKNSRGNEKWYNSKGNKITEKEYIISILIKWRDESNARV